MASVTVESATRADVDAIVEDWVALASHQRFHGSHLLAEENRATVRENVTHHVVGDRILVARDESVEREGGSGEASVVGFVQFAPEEGNYRMDADRGVVETLYVTPSRRGEGIGSRLLQHAERALIEDGMETVSLEVMAANDDARRFYARHGYEIHRIAMEKPLENDTH